MAIKFKNHYSQIGKKEEFKVKYTAEDKTDQSQLCSASITEMAKRFGIDAIIAKAQQTTIDTNLQDKLYGNDYTQMFKSKEDLLNVKKKLNNVFENIPAILRKQLFNDNPMEFINAYTTNDEIKLGKLKEIGLVSETQFEQVKQFNAQRKAEKQENETRLAFINKLEKEQGAMYEQFKKTGNINYSSKQDNSVHTGDVQTGVQQSD